MSDTENEEDPPKNTTQSYSDIMNQINYDLDEISYNLNTQFASFGHTGQDEQSRFTAQGQNSPIKNNNLNYDGYQVNIQKPIMSNTFSNYNSNPQLGSLRNSINEYNNQQNTSQQEEKIYNSRAVQTNILLKEMKERKNSMNLSKEKKIQKSITDADLKKSMYFAQNNLVNIGDDEQVEVFKDFLTGVTNQKRKLMISEYEVKEFRNSVLNSYNSL